MHIEVTGAVFGYGKRPVVQVDELHLRPGRSLGIFGPNGSGKTTLVRGISGLLPPLSGSVTRKPEIRIGYLPQYRAIDLHWPMSGLDAALLAASAREKLGWVGARRAARAAMRKPRRRLACAFAFLQSQRRTTTAASSSPAQWRRSRMCCCSTNRQTDWTSTRAQATRSPPRIRKRRLGDGNHQS